jgi:hypothetical protein
MEICLHLSRGGEPYAAPPGFGMDVFTMNSVALEETTT